MTSYLVGDEPQGRLDLFIQFQTRVHIRRVVEALDQVLGRIAETGALSTNHEIH